MSVRTLSAASESSAFTSVITFIMAATIIAAILLIALKYRIKPRKIIKI
jgi:hypothetical protein